MKINIYYFLFTLFVLAFSACSDEVSETTEDEVVEFDLIEDISIQLNPTGYAPLTALLSLETKEEVEVEITVIGKNGDASSVTKHFDQKENLFELEILGLYADYLNQIDVKILSNAGDVLQTQRVEIQTESLISELPQITIDVASSSSKSEFNLVNYYGYDQNRLPQTAFMFDQFGDIRWYFDFTTHPELFELFADNGITRLTNGNLLFGNNNNNTIYETDLMGNVINTWPLNGFGYHHHVIEKPNGNLLATVNDNSISTIEDVVLELDRSTGEVVNKWDLNNSLDNTRRAWSTQLADLDVDWFHVNALEYSAIDNEIIVSGRTQGIVKLNDQNEVSYILAPHKEWETFGNEIDLSQFLLTPLDGQGNKITDEDVLLGNTNHEDFEWPWYQHSPILMPNGNLMVFDNGENRNYNDFEQYSRAVEYEIDEENKTIKQVWTYGKERGEETYARIVSKVSYVAENNSVLFTPGSSYTNEIPTGKVIEVDHSTKEVLFEASVVPPNPVFIITFHNVLRMPLYN